MTAANLTERALAFAVDSHRGQTRKDSGAPYAFHVVEVSKGLCDVGICDPEILCAALLHDVVEDTPVTAQEVEERFGKRVAGMVVELTHDEERVSKADYLASFEAASTEALAVKLIDRHCNVSDYRLARPDYAPEYAAKANAIYDAIESRAGDLAAMFGDAPAARLAAICKELRLVAGSAD